MAKKQELQNNGADKAKVLEMAKDIVNLELRLIKSRIGSGICPFAVSPLKTHLGVDCNTTTCRDCKDIWAKEKRKEIIEEVIAHYDLQDYYDLQESEEHKNG